MDRADQPEASASAEDDGTTITGILDWRSTDLMVEPMKVFEIRNPVKELASHGETYASIDEKRHLSLDGIIIESRNHDPHQ